jgi:Putative restriction endonuclease
VPRCDLRRTDIEREEAAVDQSVFDHEGPWTEAAYLALQHDGRVEVVDGTLLVGPGASPKRRRVIERVRAALAAALPDGLRVQGPVPLRLGRDCVLVPDLIVTAAPAEEPGAETEDEAEDEAADEKPADEAASDEKEDGAAEVAVLEAAAALMVIEVVGWDHGATDRSFKPQLYARSRIPYSLLIDHDSPFAVADMIIGGRYHEYARAGGEERLLLEEPFRFELDLAELTAPGPPESSESSDAEAPPTQALPKLSADASRG